MKITPKNRILIILLYLSSVILLYIGVMIPTNPRVTLNAILYNTKKELVVLFAVILSLVAEKLSGHFAQNSTLKSTSKEDTKKVYLALFLTMGIILAAVISFTLYIFSNPVPSIVAFLDLIEFAAAMVIILSGPIILYDLGILRNKDS